jgi:hypothetical protein
MLLVLPVIAAWGAKYYVDYSAGTDVNNGMSTITSFKHCPGDTNATNIAAGIALTAGDTIVFKGGVQYESSILIKWNGIGEGSRIVYDGNSDGTWGSGRAIIDGGAVRNYCFGFSASQSFISISNFELRHTKKASNSGRLVYDNAGSNHVTLCNCILHDAGSEVVATLSGCGIWSKGGSYWTINNNIFYDCYDTAIVFSPGSYNKMYSNEFYDIITWGILIQSNADNIVNNEIYENTFHDISYYDGRGPHVDYIFLSLLGVGKIENTSIYNNSFSNSTSFTDYGGTAMIFLQISGEYGANGQINNTRVFGNVFYNQHSYMCLEFDSALGPISGLYIYNNSYYTSRDVTFIGLYWSAGHYDYSNIFVKNNICYSQNAVCIDLQTDIHMNGKEFDYNCWSSSNSAPFKVAGNYLTWTQWRALGNDSHGLYANPSYVDTGILSWNLHLKKGSPAIDTGAPLGSPYDKDKEGISRPTGAQWDMGAYEYSSRTGNKLDVPSNLRIRK